MGAPEALVGIKEFQEAKGVYFMAETFLVRLFPETEPLAVRLVAVIHKAQEVLAEPEAEAVLETPTREVLRLVHLVKMEEQVALREADPVEMELALLFKEFPVVCQLLVEPQEEVGEVVNVVVATELVVVAEEGDLLEIPAMPETRAAQRQPQQPTIASQ